MTESDEIEEILYEAHSLGIRDLVMERASKILKAKPKSRKSDAYRKSLDYWKNNMPVQIGSGGMIGSIKQSEK
jgi:hypothetical protein